MRWIYFVPVMTLALVTFLAAASEHADGTGRSDLRNQDLRRIPRLETDLRGPRSRKFKRYSSSFGQRYRDQELSRGQAIVPGRCCDCTTLVELRAVRREQQGIWPRSILRCRIAPRIGTCSSWSRTQKNTLQPAGGGTLNLIRTASLPTKRSMELAFPVTYPSKIATMSSPITRL